MAHILIVDDELPIREVVRSTLQAAGHTVSEAANGVEAERKIRTEKFDLMITDIMMPARDGLETLINLQQDKNPLRVIAITGVPFDSKFYLKVAHNLGASRTLTKPFTASELVEVTNEVLAQPIRRKDPAT